MTKATLIALPVIILATILPATSGPRASRNAVFQVSQVKNWTG